MGRCDPPSTLVVMSRKPEAWGCRAKEPTSFRDGGESGKRKEKENRAKSMCFVDHSYVSKDDLWLWLR